MAPPAPRKSGRATVYTRGANGGPVALCRGVTPPLAQLLRRWFAARAAGGASLRAKGGSAERKSGISLIPDSSAPERDNDGRALAARGMGCQGDRNSPRAEYRSRPTP